MAWELSGRSAELCSCNMFCPCWFGPEGKPDLGWCGGAFAFDIERGNSDNINLDGTRSVLTAEWPGNFFDGNGRARLYLSEADSAQQREELEAIFRGKKGGPLAPLWDAVVKEWLSTEVANIDIVWDEISSISVGKFGQAKLTPLRDQAGRSTKITGAAAQAAFQLESMDVASAQGSNWADPSLRAWKGDSGTLHEFNWRS